MKNSTFDGSGQKIFEKIDSSIFATASEASKVVDEDWIDDCYIWLNRGIWQNVDVSDIDMAIPLSPGERLKKRRAIFKHTSQKDQLKYPGSVNNEFWMVADDKTIKNAMDYDRFGLAEYNSIEGFSRWRL